MERKFIPLNSFNDNKSHKIQPVSKHNFIQFVVKGK